MTRTRPTRRARRWEDLTPAEQEFYGGFVQVLVAPKPAATLEPGTRVVMTGDHPWAGHSGAFVEWQNTMFGERPVILLDNGERVFAMQPGDFGPAPQQAGAR